MRAISKLHGCSMLLYLTRVMMEMIICFVIIPTVRDQVSKYVKGLNDCSVYIQTSCS